MSDNSKITVYAGLSGGVDSSVTAARLVDSGYNVVGVFMKNWAQDIAGWECPWKEDYQDAKRVAVQLGIDFKMFDFQKDYREQVVDYMLDTYKRGETPNPDVMCNQEIKFKLFLEAALADGADMIATGHYASVKKSEDGIVNSAELHTARDDFKDQTYFLYRVEESALEKTLFPLSDSLKKDVKAEAKKRGLVTAGKKESMGICFVGKVGIKDFLKEFVETEPGPVIDQHGQEIGQHEGAIFYTIGQRQGLGIGGGLPYYVTHKDMDLNTVFVTSDVNDEKLWSDSIVLASPHWINGEPHEGEELKARIRHQGELIDCVYGGGRLKLAKELKALSPGQSAVLYRGSHCLGGGIIS